MWNMFRQAGARLLPALLLSAALVSGCASDPAASPAESVQAPASGGSAPPAQTAAASPGTAPASPEAGALPGAGSAPAVTAAAEPSAGGATARPAASPGAVQPGPGAGAATAPAASFGTGANGPGKSAPAGGSAKPASTARPSAAAETAAPVRTASAQAPSPSPKVSAVTLSIVGDDELGTVLPPTAVQVEKGDSVLDVLKKATRERKIQMEFSGAKAFGYVKGIANLYEMDHGAESGWMYRVNGSFPNESAGTYALSPGDTVEWLYTLDMGKDLGASR